MINKEEFMKHAIREEGRQRFFELTGHKYDSDNTYDFSAENGKYSVDSCWGFGFATIPLTKEGHHELKKYFTKPTKKAGHNNPRFSEGHEKSQAEKEKSTNT